MPMMANALPQLRRLQQPAGGRGARGQVQGVLRKNGSLFDSFRVAAAATVTANAQNALFVNGVGSTQNGFTGGKPASRTSGVEGQLGADEARTIIALAIHCFPLLATGTANPQDVMDTLREWTLTYQPKQGVPQELGPLFQWPGGAGLYNAVEFPTNGTPTRRDNVRLLAEPIELLPQVEFQFLAQCPAGYTITGGVDVMVELLGYEDVVITN